MQVRGKVPIPAEGCSGRWESVGLISHLPFLIAQKGQILLLEVLHDVNFHELGELNVHIRIGD